MKNKTMQKMPGYVYILEKKETGESNFNATKTSL